MLSTIVVFLLILSLLVLIHEAGHYFVARFFGMKIEEFGFGFPPKVFGKKIGETLYSLNLLPIGGFVKIYGEDEAGSGKIGASKKITKDLDRAFFNRPIYQRALVVIAGVAMNFILAIGIITYLITFEGIPSQGKEVKISQVIKGSPAGVAGLKSGDIIEKVEKVKVVQTEALISETRKHLGQKISLTIKRDNSQKEVLVTPRKNSPKDQGPMGIAIEQNVVYEKHPFPQSLIFGIKQAGSDSVQIVLGFKTVVIDIFTHLNVPQGVAGPIGMAQLTGEVVKVGPVAVLSLIYMLSLSLAVLNVLPIPALDGGRLFFIIIEAVTRRKVHPKFESYAHAIGIILLLTFLAVVSYKDILRIVSGQSIFPQ